MFSYSTTGKRLLDICLSAAGLAFTLPLIVAVALVIRTTLGSPMLFTQVRPGRHGRPFILYKFRSMSDARAPDGELLGDEARLTAVGHWLRKLSLDELPQLWNVLRGEMSLVGPRPLIETEDQLVDGWGRRRLELTPGITGLWQVLGRTAIPFEEMVKLDYLYVANWSVWGDIRLILRTLPVILSRRGAN
jgi:lipopolysaccharide/colanic/teichoic acid biosynthesis glycosyltransferase